jgi:hypothetical protein
MEGRRDGGMEGERDGGIARHCLSKHLKYRLIIQLSVDNS